MFFGLLRFFSPIPVVEETPPGKFIPPSAAETDKLRIALKRNGHNDVPMFMDARDTSWRDGVSKDEYDRQQDAECVNAVKSIACHY